MVSGAATLGGGTVSTSISAATNVNHLQGDLLGTLVVGGAGSSYTGVFTQVNVTGLGAAASAVTIGANTDLVATVSNNYIGATLPALGNSGTIVAVTALYVGSSGSVGSVSNTGALSGSVVGVINNGTVGTLTNSGTVTGSIAGVANAGSVGSFSNDGSVSGSIAGVSNSGTIGTLGNTGTVTGSVTGLGNQAGASIGTLSNSGTVAGQMALYNAGTIEVVVNDGALIDAGAPTAAGLYNTGNIATVLNSGTILGATYGVYNAGTIGTLANSGLITAPTALYIDTGARLGVLANSGTVTGNILNLSANTLSITGGSGTVVGTLTGHAAGSQGSIINTFGNVVLASGNLLLNDAVNVAGHTLVNSGASVILDSLVSVTGAYSQTGGTLTVDIAGGGGLAVSGAASLGGGTVLAQYNATGNYLAGVDTLVTGGAGSSYTGVVVQGSLTGLAVTESVVGTNLVAVVGNDYVGGSLASLGNTGTLTAATAVYIAASGSLGSLANSGTITGNVVNLSANTLTITGGVGTTVGTLTGGTITSTGANVVLAAGNVALKDAVNVGAGTLVNSGASVLMTSVVSVTGDYSQTGGTLTAGIGAGTAGELQVSGNAGLTGGTVAVTAMDGANLLAGDRYTIVEAGGSLVASGLTAAASGFTATLGTSLNGTDTDLVLTLVSDYIGGTLGTLTNTGTLNAPTAVNITAAGSLGTLANSGTIIGNVVNASANDLVIVGGSGAVVGGFSGGTIRNSLSNLAFVSGNVSLADSIDVTGHTVANTGASLILASDISISGAFGQTAGTLSVAGHVLSVSGPALVSGGTVSAGVSGVGNYFVGDSVTMIQGGTGSSYTGAVVTSGLAGLDANGSVSGNNLLAVAGNDYIGASLNVLNVTGTLVNTAGGATALYIASTGTLGNLANSGTISGNVVNQSARDLTINGGGNGAVGRFSGGTITSTGANVVFASGAVSLGDAINVATHTVSNAGASLSLAGNVGITGNFAQSGGTLTTGGRVLTVSGAANMTGGVVNAGVSAVGNYLVGDSVTLIQGGTGSNYAGATVTSGIAGLSATGTTSGTNLLAVAGNDYVGGSLNALSVTGTLANTAGGATALYIAATGTLGTLANGGTITGNVVNLSASDLVVSGASGGGTDAAPGVFTGGTITNTRSDLRFVRGVMMLNDRVNVGSHSVVNSGATLLVNSAVNITGSYSQTAGGLVIGVSSTTSYGTLVISGGASLTGGSVTLTAVKGGQLSAGSYTIASAGSTLTTSNLTLTAAGYTVTSSTITANGATDLVLTLSGGSGGTTGPTGPTGPTNPTTPSTRYTAVGLAAGGPAVGTGRALDVIANSDGAAAQAFQAAVLTRLSKLPGAEQQLAVTQLSPSQLTPQINTFSATPSTNAISQHQQHAAAHMDGSGKGAAAGSDGQQGAVWGEILGGGVLRGNSADAAGYSGTTAGLVIGADWYANDTVMAGLAFSWLNGSVDGQGTAAGSQTKAASYQLTAYSVWRPDWADQRLSVEGQASFGYNHYDQRRWIGFLGARANANYGGEQYLGKVTVGYDLPVSASFTLTPQASLRAVRLTNHAYDERDAGVANMAVGALKVDSLTQELGAKLSGKMDTGLGRLLPDLRLSWVHDYLNGPIATTSVLAGTSFVSSTGRTAADGLGIGVGATLDQGDGFKLRLEYSGELRRDYQSHAGLLRATFDF
ncbi:beta strand repeat-containing protein [Nitrospirillum sp. BR 11163]|uniref:beta strand repeat-containing protein n=1 Tax=Nitrospirillum sp. BR 11163 TaxID=3104323 RepID=UPI002B00A3AC|nr:autotransporter domain-containing protein [Nitrospirillum sp. BR 11163]